MTASRPLTSWQRAWPTVATFVLVIVAIGCLYFARGVLIPTAVAVLLTFVLSPVVTLLQRRGLPRTAAVVVVVLVAGLLATAVAALVVTQIGLLLSELPVYQDNVASKIGALRAQSNGSLIAKVQEFLETINKAATQPLGRPSNSGTAPVAVEVVARTADWNIAPWLGGLSPLIELLASTGLVIVLVIYSLIFREDLRSRLLVLVGKGHLTLTTKALDDAGRRISRYLLAQLILNATFGLSIGVGLLLLGVPYALLWGFLAGVFRYIPFVGPWIAAIFPLSMSLLVSAGWWNPVLVVALFVGLELLNNLVIEPWAFGQSIGVSQSAILVAIAFWAWLWGPVGLMLAAPLTVCLVVMGKYVPTLRFFDILLGDEPVMTADANFYQRLLARDDDEATEIIRKQGQTLSPLELCDQLLIPALVHARQDAEADLLTEAEFDFIHATIRESLRDQVELQPIPPAEPALGDEPEREPLSVLGCAARDAADATALEILEQHLPTKIFRMDTLTSERLVSEVVEHVASLRPGVVCIAALPAGGLSHTRHLCKRLRQHYPNLKIVVGRWGGNLTPEHREQLTSSGADYVGVTVQQTCSQLEELAQFLRPEPLPAPPPGTQLRADGPHESPEPVLAVPAVS